MLSDSVRSEFGLTVLSVVDEKSDEEKQSKGGEETL